MALIAIVFAVGSSDAANCTATTFKQDLEKAKVDASNLILEEYAKSTKEQIIKKFMDLYNDKIVSFEYTLTEKADTITIDYKIICACNETTTTVLPDGTKKTTQVVSSVDKKKMENTVKTGL